jgi:hypothetical protein
VNGAGAKFSRAALRALTVSPEWHLHKDGTLRTAIPLMRVAGRMTAERHNARRGIASKKHMNLEG